MRYTERILSADIKKYFWLIFEICLQIFGDIYFSDILKNIWLDDRGQSGEGVEAKVT